MATSAPARQKELFGQPIGLYFLFFTEMWERFSYYGMRAILVLYLVEKTTSDNPGLGWANGDALTLYGWYTMLVYVACIPGGLIADNLFGQKKTVMWGAISLVIGHSILAVQAMWAFYSGLAFIVIGVGMLKANISTMVGGLYEQGDIRRDKAFTIFYIGINTGALLAAISVGYVGEKIGWHYGFGMAGIGMALGLIVYLSGQKHVKDINTDSAENGDKKNEEKQEPSIKKIYADLFKSPKQLLITGVLALFSLYWIFFSSIPNGLLFLFITAVVALMMMIYKDLGTQLLKDRYLVLIIAFLMIIVFFGAFEQAGGLMSLYAKTKTDRLIPPDFPLLGGLEVPATWFQSLNSIFIIIFGVIVANFWAKRKLKNKEASSLFKMAIGIIIMGLGFLFMAGAATQYTPGGEKAGMYWLVLAFLLHTLGELCASPVSLSFITKLAPLKYASLMMGLYFAATGFGNRMAGFVGNISQSEPMAIELDADKSKIQPFLDEQKKAEKEEMIEKGGKGNTAIPTEVKDSSFVKDQDFVLHAEVFPKNGKFEAMDANTGKSLLPIIKFETPDRIKEVTHILADEDVTKADPYHVDFVFEKKEAAEVSDHPMGYAGSFIIQEVQTQSEFKTFIGITIFTALFGLLVISIIKPLKRLTHGVEEEEHEITESGDA